jgi:hypothetical protein
MKKGQTLGLDELMIVNPSPSPTTAYFLGEDGTLYQVEGVGEGEARQGLGHFFLSADGTLYQAGGVETRGDAAASEVGGEAESGELGRFFLGADGTLYERVK